MAVPVLVLLAQAFSPLPRLFHMDRSHFHFKQKDLVAVLGVTESHVSTLLSGKNNNVSVSVAYLIEEKLGYNAQWILTGEEPKYKQISKNPNISDTHKRVILQLEKMSDVQIRAVLAFINSLEEVEKILQTQKDVQSDESSDLS